MLRATPVPGAALKHHSKLGRREARLAGLHKELWDCRGVGPQGGLPMLGLES